MTVPSHCFSFTNCHLSCPAVVKRRLSSSSFVRLHACLCLSCVCTCFGRSRSLLTCLAARRVTQSARFHLPLAGACWAVWLSVCSSCCSQPPAARAMQPSSQYYRIQLFFCCPWRRWFVCSVVTLPQPPILQIFDFWFIIRPYSQWLFCCVTVSWSLGHTRVLCKNDWTDCERVCGAGSQK